MKSYLKLSGQYLKAHKKSSRLAMMSVVISVALVVGMISLLGSMVNFERQSILKTEGNYHILVRNTTEQERKEIAGRFEVDKSGLMLEFENGEISGRECAMGAIDSSMSENLNFHLISGKYPVEDNELMLEQWYVKQAGLKQNDLVSIKLSDGKVKTFLLSGIYQDWGETKASDIPIAILSMKAANTMKATNSSYFILFKKGVNIATAEKNICKAYQIDKKRIARNEGLLALSLQSKNSRVLEYYVIGTGMFFLVLLTAVVMIYNSLNISVLERVKHFGLLRCIGTSKKQVKKLVRREALIVAIKAIPFGILAGMLMASLCLAVLKFFNSSMYGNISLISISPAGIAAGIILGLVTVLVASFNPAKRASKVSPVSALTGIDETAGKKRKNWGVLTKLLPVEIVMGIKNALKQKKTLVLMAGSVGLSILLFLLFQSLINPDLMGMRPTRNYTADVRISSTTGISSEFYHKLEQMDGVKGVNARMSSYVDASVKKEVMTAFYQKKLKNKIKTDGDGYTTNAEKSWLMSYDKQQLAWAKQYLSKGTTNQNILNKKYGLIAVNKIIRDKLFLKTTDFKLGDKVKIKTASGVTEFEIVGIVDSLPYSTDETTMTTFVTSEEVYKKISQDNEYKTIDIHLTKKHQEETVKQIKQLAGDSYRVGDQRQMNAKTNNAYMTVAVFIYGFAAVIALISILNIVNTISASVIAKTKRFGVMRAVGMTGGQLTRLIVTEALVFCLTGCVVGTIVGVFLRHQLMNFFLISYHFPTEQVVMIIVACLLAAVIAVLAPLRKLRSKGVTEIISEM